MHIELHGSYDDLGNLFRFRCLVYVDTSISCHPSMIDCSSDYHLPQFETERALTASVVELVEPIVERMLACNNT